MGVIHKSTMYIRRIEVNWVVMSMAQKICKIFYPLLDTSRHDAASPPRNRRRGGISCNGKSGCRRQNPLPWFIKLVCGRTGGIFTADKHNPGSGAE